MKKNDAVGRVEEEYKQPKKDFVVEVKGCWEKGRSVVRNVFREKQGQ
jgi:hypothetical protein